ncbi:MAG: hypothetical protein ACRC18_06310 [Cetobacterium sp.]
MNFDYYTVDPKMTLFYSLSTGKIKQYCTGVQTLDYFGEDKRDYNYGYLVVDNDEFITRNLENFIVENGEVVMMQPQNVSKYRMSYR